MLSLRALASDDYQSWKRLWDGYLSFYKTELSDEITANTWRELNDSKSLITGFVAEIDSKVCAIAHCFLRPSTWHPVGYLYLEDLFVDPEYRGAGVGRALLDKAAEYGREIGAERLYWITKEDNAQARVLYDSFVKGAATGFIQYEYLL